MKVLVEYKSSASSLVLNKWSIRKIAFLSAILLLIWLLLSPSLVSAFAGLGGYISEKMLGDGTNESLYLGDGVNDLMALGSCPVVSTLTAVDVSMAGGGTATLRGKLLDLNGMPQADVWFSWGYDSTSMTNDTASKTVLSGGAQSETITGFDTKQDIYYQFNASTDAETRGNTQMIPAADIGFSLLDLILPIIIALAIFISILLFIGNPLIALVYTIIGLVAFDIVKSILEGLL